ncbi:MAG: ECF transporter S component [Clostridia bacterium]|nr:ECF transporter S component [Clostridia bacterium]
MTEHTHTETGLTNKTTQFVVRVAMLSALGFLLMLLEFPLPFMPPWMKLDISDTAVIAAGCGLGPWGAVAVALIKNLLHFLLKNNDGTIVGEIAAFAIGVAIAVPLSFIYRRDKSRKSMLMGLVVGGIVMTVAGALLNAYVLLPVYAKVFGMPIESLVAMATKVNPLITDLKGLIFIAVVPFNIIKAVVLAILMMLLYNVIERTVSIK